MKAKVGTSILKNSYDAGVEIIERASIGIKNPKIGFLFSSVKYNHNDLMNGILSVNPSLDIIGMTSSDGIMTQEGIITSEDGFAGLLLLEDNELKVSIAASKKEGDARTTGQKIAQEALEKSGKKYAPSRIAIFSTPADEEEYLKGIQDILGDVPIFGGSSCDDSIVGDWKVLSSEGNFKSGCAIALFYTTKEIKTVFNSGYEETDNFGLVTRIDEESIISEIDYVPALKKYAEWTGYSEEELMGQKLMMASTKYPIGIKNLQGDLIDIKHPIIGSPDYSLILDTNITDKIAIIQMKTNPEILINSAIKTIDEIKYDFEPAAYLLIQNGFTEKFIDDRIDEYFVALKNQIGELPFIVAFSFKEYGQKNHSSLMASSLSMSFTGFSK